MSTVQRASGAIHSVAAVRALVALGAVLTALSLLAGHANRHLLDGPTFAEHVDQIRTDDAVSVVLGRAISAQVIRANPDLVALRPLVEGVSIRIAGSELLSGPTRFAARTAHQALTEGDSDLAVLRIIDAGAVATAVLAAAAPDRAPVDTPVSVTLAEVGSQSFASATVQVARTVGVLVWVLPLVAIACFGAAVGLSRNRWRTASLVGRSVLASAASVGGLLIIGGFAVRRSDADVIAGAVAQAAWSAIVRPLWWGVALLAAAGVAVVLATDPSGHQTIARHRDRAVALVLRRPRHPAGVVLRALIVGVIGIAAMLDPLGLMELLLVLAGVALVLFAISEISTLALAARAGAATGSADRQPGSGQAAPDGRSARPVAATVAGATVLAVAIGVAMSARPGEDVVLAGTGTVTVCNGHAELCERPFDEVAYVASHNSMSVADGPGWFIPEQSDSIPRQLDQGVRALLIDVWSGRRAATVVRTAESSHGEALRVAEEELGPEVVAAALRIADAVAGVAAGPEARFLCHGLCEIGSTSFADMLEQLRSWLVANPSEVVTLFIEDHVDPSLIAADIESAGLLPFIHTPVAGAPWPSLGEMITSGRRLVVMLEAGSGGADAAWLVNGFEFTQDTPYTFPTVGSFSCEPNRGNADAPLFLLNHWLANFDSLVTDARLVNDREVLLARAEQCQTDRGQIPNFVAVNFVSIGHVHDVVDALNGVEE